MTPLRIDWTPRALREAKRLDPPTRQRIATALDAFVETERGDVVLLTDVTPPEYRLRVGAWRVRFRVDRKAGALVVLRVLPRGKAYRQLSQALARMLENATIRAGNEPRASRETPLAKAEMGLFDTIHCEYPLPDPRHQELDFQTKDLECLLDVYTITRDGRLLRHARPGGRGPERDVEWPIHADVRIYDLDPSGDGGLLEYVVRFTHGRVEWIRPLAEATNAPALPPPEDLGGAASGTETSLLANLRRERHDLEKLLTACDGHWGYEDPVYRFYHQSFKVYGLQGSTRAIVRTLQSLAPDRPLNPWFLEIVGSGTGKEFRAEDNAHWTEVTRPIVEAFFHARFFLEMAVRYADLDAPPRPLSSGYAALLELFGLR